MIYAWSPIHIDEDDYPYLHDDDPIDIAECESWPPMATQYALDDLPGPVVDDLIDEAGADVTATILDGDYLHVPLDREAELLAVLGRHGLEARRDDNLIAGLGE